MVHYSGKYRERDKESDGGGEGEGGGEREEGRKKERGGRKTIILRKTNLNKNLMHFKESSHLRCMC